MCSPLNFYLIVIFFCCLFITFHLSISSARACVRFACAPARNPTRGYGGQYVPHAFAYFGILRHTSALAADSTTFDALGFAVVRPRLSPVLAAIGCLHVNVNEKNSTRSVGFSKLTLTVVAAGSLTQTVTALLCECLQDFHTCASSQFVFYAICKENFIYLRFYSVCFCLLGGETLDILPPSKMHFRISFVTL